MQHAGVVKVVFLLVFVGLVAWFYMSGADQHLDPKEFRTWIRESRPWGGLLFLAAFALLQPVGVPSTFLLLVSPMVWPPVQAFFLNWLGVVATGVVSYGFARFVARDWVQGWLPPRVRRFDERLQFRGFVTVLVLRLAFYANPTVQYALGISRVRFDSFLLGTALGMIPYTLLVTFVGAQFNDWIETHPPSTWRWIVIGPALVVFTILSTGVFFLIARRRRPDTA